MTEAELCTAFIADATKNGNWTAYPETGDFDIILVRKDDGAQIGIEAKLSLNVKVLEQALPSYRFESDGPDYRAVLVPAAKVQVGLATIAGYLGITVLTYDAARFGRDNRVGYDMTPGSIRPSLPTRKWDESNWHEWCPIERIRLPEYTPDVEAGRSAPVALTEWKIKAIKLAILLEDRPVTRADFHGLKLSPTRWTNRHDGWLVPTPEGYVPGKSMPDFKAQHPVNYEQIKADRAKWSPGGGK
jgi:hypothetical protein